MDPRFDTSRDPRFRRAPKHVRRVQVDKRFAHMFTDEQFIETPTVDPRGRKLRRNAGARKLKEFYDVADEEEKAGSEEPASGGNVPGGKRRAAKLPSAPEAPEPRKGPRGKRRAKARAQAEADEPKAEEEAEEADAESEEAGQSDAEAHDEGEEEEEPEEEEEDDEDDEEDEEEQFDEKIWEAPELADVPKGEATRRIALMGCDWDRTSPVDLLVLLRNYLSSKEALKGSGALRAASVDRVSIYPSDYGIEEMKKENAQGPSLEKPAPIADVTEKEEVANEALRRYQMQRTRYYYAVAECDSVATAAWMYDQIDGLEVNGLCPGMLDVRFIPDDLTFPHEAVSQATEVPPKYSAPLVVDTNLSHTKVKCTWDEAPVRRQRDLMKKAFTPDQLRDADLEAYLASSDEEDKDPERVEALRSLVRGAEEDLSGLSSDDEELKDKAPKQVMGDMEATFNLKTEQLSKDLTEKVQKQGGGRRVVAEEAEEKTVWQQYLDKRKAKRKERREASKKAREAKKSNAALNPEDAPGSDAEQEKGDLELLVDDVAVDDRNFNLRSKKRGPGGQAKAQEDDKGFQVDVDDPRIEKIFSSADFEIDPTNPEFRASDGMSELLRKKRRNKPKRLGSAAGSKAAEPAAAPSDASRPVPGDASLSTTGGLQLFASSTRREGSDARTAPGADATGAASKSREPQASPPASEAPARKKRRKAGTGAA